MASAMAGAASVAERVAFQRVSRGASTVLREVPASASASQGFLPREVPLNPAVGEVAAMMPVEAAAAEGISGGAASAAEGGLGAAAAADAGFAPGANALTGAFQGAMEGLFATELRALQAQVAPENRGMVMAAAQVATFGLACLIARAAPCRAAAGVVGNALRRIPLLGGDTWLASYAQIALGAAVGRVVGEQLSQAREGVSSFAAAAADAADAVPDLPVVHVADTCIVCAEQFPPGARVAALSCGHACMCAGGCSGMWAENFHSCPMCRAEPVQITSIQVRG
mmetsp:Transcript_58745/g.139979  ORF Transcript_58745/g.139979 Transcript_58745/m.139979 type:complete len:283 (-) Transcript_58745:139-987(-)|eukprot:CAMPEP_0178388686 /NCGR_PEP_ID=MMETSP0689_2-20121128/9723_1 /TAXON_ID=160604 /ORGANISM="Amphidinium massartii, Strain CS-259" /LENGTH=282 /DNA_ID=CAMNT_0020009101 /DNA_START=30 /DNA_END=878 /DNA_ORIENTATION=+